MTDWRTWGFWYTSHLQGFLLLCSFSPPGVDSIHILRIWVLSSGQNSLTNPGISTVWTEVSIPLFLAKHSTALAASWLPYCVALRHKLFYKQYNQMLVPFEGMLSGQCFFFFLTSDSGKLFPEVLSEGLRCRPSGWELRAARTYLLGTTSVTEVAMLDLLSHLWMKADPLRRHWDLPVCIMVWVFFFSELMAGARYGVKGNFWAAIKLWELKWN